MATEIESAGMVTDSQNFPGFNDDYNGDDGRNNNKASGDQAHGQGGVRTSMSRRAEIRVFKKSSPSGYITVYLGKRDFVDHIDHVDPIDGIILLDRDYVKDKKVLGHVMAAFSYGRDDLDVLGLTFRKELYLANEQIFPDPKRRHYNKNCPYYVEGSDQMASMLMPSPASVTHNNNDNNGNPATPTTTTIPTASNNMQMRPLTNLQERLIKKLGANAFPFCFELPPLSPSSVTLQPGPGDSGKPCGVDYELKAHIVDPKSADKPNKRDSIRLAIRKIMYAPSTQGEQPIVEVSKDFVMSPNKLNLEVSLDRDLYHHGESIAVNVHISNNSNRTVKKVKVSVRQFADICLFSTAQYKCNVAEVESDEGCPVGPGATLSKVYYLRPLLADNRDKRGLALDGQIKHEDTNLASSTLISDTVSRENSGIVVMYKVRVKLSLGALNGDILAELPVTLMHPKPEEDEDELEMARAGHDGSRGRTTICKCDPEQQQQLEQQARKQQLANGLTKQPADEQTPQQAQTQSEQPTEFVEDLIQLGNYDEDDIVFEDFARMRANTAELSTSNRSTDEMSATPSCLTKKDATTDCDDELADKLSSLLTQNQNQTPTTTTSQTSC